MLLGLVILSTLLVSVAIARGRFARQYADADRRLRLTRAADALLAGWMAGPPQAVPRNGRGRLGDGGVWRTSVRPDPAVASLSAFVVRLEVVDPKGDNTNAVQFDFVVRDAARPADAENVDAK